jgi:hypothetical protein
VFIFLGICDVTSFSCFFFCFGPRSSTEGKKEKRNYFVLVFAPVQKQKTISFLSFVLIQKKQKIKKQQAVRAQSDFAPLIRE